MRIKIHEAILELAIGDITQQNVDAIVNAANSHLAGGGGVDGAIHRAGGPTIMQETDRLYPNGCPTGSAVITTGGNLPAKFILHAVGPVWHGGKKGEPELLRSAHWRCLELALENTCTSLAFPAISTGVYGYPLQAAAEVALSTVIDFLKNDSQLNLVRFVLFGNEAFSQFATTLKSQARNE